MKELRLTKGYVAVVDDEDYSLVAGDRWYAHVKTRSDGTMRVYAKRRIKTLVGWSMQSLHRVIMDAPDGIQVDHINGKGLDNRRSNLRMCSHAENQHNRRPQTGCTSKFKGVYWNKAGAKWMARIGVNGKQKHLGSFTSEQDAAQAYNLAAAVHYGEYGRLNDLVGV